MAQKNLKELLKEDQEPFYLKSYIADKQKQCNLLKNQAPNTHIKLHKPKSTSIFSKNSCFFSLQDSPDIRKSPLFDFTATSPVSKKSPNRVFINVPAKTASLILEAALRIQKQSKPSNKVTNSRSFGLFGSMLKRLTLRNRIHKLKSNEDEAITTANLIVGVEEEKVATVSCSSCSSSSSCHEGSSSLDFESSISGRSFEDDDDDDGFEFVNVLQENHKNDGGDYTALLTPFRFSLHNTPPFPPKSPASRKFQDISNYVQESRVSKCELEEKEDDEDNKEQNSPVSVLDHPFEDDHDGQEEDSYNQDRSYAFVQRAKEQLLQKLHRFERLAELDPIELEKRMIEEEDDSEEQGDDDFDEDVYQVVTFPEQRQVSGLLHQVVVKSGNQDVKKPGIKRLISDIIIEEQSLEYEIENELLIKRVCKTLGSWKEVECNTIDMMVEIDLRTEIIDWKKPQRTEIWEVATDVEVAIFSALFSGLVEDLVLRC